MWVELYYQNLQNGLLLFEKDTTLLDATKICYKSLIWKNTKI